MLRVCIIFLSLSLFCYSQILNLTKTKIIKFNESASYFGYSILLQKGTPPIAIVGAPGYKELVSKTGAIFKCDFQSLNCIKYSNFLTPERVDPPQKNGDCLGMVLDGEEKAGGKFFTCAPRFIRNVHLYQDSNYYTNGRCFYVKNSTFLDYYPIIFNPLSPYRDVSVGFTAYYDSAFGEAGMAISYSESNEELTVGAPGKSVFNGAILTMNLNWGSNPELFSNQRSLVNDNYKYDGYAVATGKFIHGSKTIWYVSGGPRGAQLRGQVVFFEKIGNDMQINAELLGEEIGSYFGASVLVLHKYFGGDDILVGAPTYSGSTRNEGCVYFYRNKGNGDFHPPLKFCGTQPDGQFGLVMSNLGDINLDGYTDCAISAPYENGGDGAVYIYYGGKNGISRDNFERITPADLHFTHNTVRGFGLGLSKGVDIAHKGHNDFVIGAYLSGHIFLMTSNVLADELSSISSNVQILYTTTTNFTLTACFLFINRNKQKSVNEINFQIIIQDDRVLKSQHISESFLGNSSLLHCRNYTVHIQNQHFSIEPLEVVFITKLRDEQKFNRKILNIPFSYGCGPDNICLTDLMITPAKEKIPSVIIGLTNVLSINITIENSGEIAYQAKLNVTIPPEISLINLRECYLETGSYICLISHIETGERFAKTFLFDFANVPPFQTNFSINFQITSFGYETTPDNNQLTLEIPIESQNNPQIEGGASPEQAIWNQSKPSMRFRHSWRVSNRGPSPLDLNFVILVPQIVNNSNIIAIESVESENEGMFRSCEPSNENISYLQMPMRNFKNDTFLLSCLNKGMQCAQFICKSGYFAKSSEKFVFSLDINVKMDFLVKFVGTDFDRIALVSFAYFNNGTEIFFATSTSFIYGLLVNSQIPLWIYVISAISGVVLLALIIFGLYKCNFFKRTLKEKMENNQGEIELTLQEEMDEEDISFN